MTEKGKKSIVVFGGEGMLGSVVYSVLSSDSGLSVRATQRSSQSRPNYFDALKEESAITAALAAGEGCDYVINCVGVTSANIQPDDPSSMENANKINSEFPYRLAEAVKQTGAKLIHISTDGVFSGRNGPYDEAAATDAEDIYGRSKRDGEPRGSHVLTVRCSIIGLDPKRKRGFFEWFRSCKPDSDLPGFTNHLWNGVTTLQFADFCRKLILENRFDQAAGTSSLRHLCPNKPISKFDLLEIFNQKTNSKIRIVPTKSETAVNRVLRSQWTDLNRLLGVDVNIADAVEAMLQDPRMSQPETSTRENPHAKT